jgi:hypothetical protein
MLTLPPWIGLIATTLVCGAAFVKGGRDEQLAAGGLVLGWIATLVLRDPRWGGTQWGGLAVDAVYLALLTVVALASARYWPIFAAAFQLLGVVTHAARTLDDGVGDWAYATAGVIWTWLVILALGVGVAGCWLGPRRLAGRGEAASGVPR